MIQILVNGLPAAIKAGSEIEYNVDNVSFAESSGYSMSIEFPLAGCPGNIAIFGHIHRDDVRKEALLLPCEIRTGALALSGALSVMDVSEQSVKGQFLEGIQSESDVESPLDTLYIDEIELGSYPVSDPAEITPEQAVAGTANEVCYPWYNISAEMPNNVYYIKRSTAQTASPEMSWSSALTKKLSWQPFLLPVVRKVIEAAGYEADLSALEESEWKDVIICNSLPGIWEMPEYRLVMPHWSPRKLLQNLGLIMKGSFIVDASEHKVSFRFYADIFRIDDERGYVVLDRVLDAYSASINRDEESADFIPLKRYKYKDQDVPSWKYLVAPYIFNMGWFWQKFDSFVDMLNRGDNGRKPAGTINKANDIDTWFVFRTHWMAERFSLRSWDGGNVNNFIGWTDYQPVDVFSPPDYDPDESYDEMEVSPAVVDYCGWGKMFWLPGFSIDNDEDSEDGGNPNLGNIPSGYPIDGSFAKFQDIPSKQSNVGKFIEARTEENSGAYFSDLYLGKVSPDPLHHPYPITDVDVDFQTIIGMTKIFRLSEGGAGGVSIDPKVKYTFKFIYDSLPEVNRVFLIHGQPYLCAKLSASISEYGLSQVFKGEFYRCL